MSSRPITLIEPQLGALMAGRLSLLMRPARALGHCQPNDRLWIREPFHLAAKYDGIAPRAAALTDARPVFCDQVASHPADALGPRRYARTMLRKWHRQHLLVTTIGRMPLQDTTLDQARAQGFATLADFCAHWDRNTDLRGERARWKHNPTVIALTFLHVPRPVAEGEG